MRSGLASGHPENIVYRCCLPTLTGFPSIRRPGLDLQHAYRESYRNPAGLTQKKRRYKGTDGMASPSKRILHEHQFAVSGNAID